MKKKVKLSGLGIVHMVLVVWMVFSSQPIASSEVRVGRISSQFRVRLFTGTVLTYQDIQGKVAVIDFWGTWCKPCLAEIPDYNLFYRDYRDKGVIFVGLAGESGSAEKVRDRCKRLNIDYPVGAPTREEFRTIGKIKAYPTTWIIAPSGEILKELIGVIPGKQDLIRKTVDDLLEVRPRNSD